MTVSIIIPAHNARTTIGRVIDACLEIDHPAKEIIVVDDGSTDGTGDIAGRYNVKLMRLRHGGLAKARNAGWKASVGDICYFTDANSIPRPNAVSVLIKHFKRTDVGGAGGTCLNGDGQKLLPTLIHSEMAELHDRLPQDTEIIESINCAYRKTALEQCGGFNENYGASAIEDNDISLRIRKNGWKLVFDPQSAVTHFHETSLANYMKRQFSRAKWKTKFQMEHGADTVAGRNSGPLKKLSPILAVAIVISSPAIFFESAREGWIGAVIFYAFVQFLKPFRISIQTGRYENVLLGPLSFLRGFALGLGFVAGVLRFGFKRE